MENFNSDLKLRGKFQNKWSQLFLKIISLAVTNMNPKDF